MSIRDELQQLADRMMASPEPIRTLHAVYQFNLGDSGSYQVQFREGQVEVSEGTAASADCTLSLSEANLRKLLNNDLNTTMAVMLGLLKIEGKLGLALKPQEILKNYM